MRYARTDLDVKRQAISQVFPDSLGVPNAGREIVLSRKPPLRG